MKRIKILLLIISVLVAVIVDTDSISANPSEGAQERNGDIFDDWGISRTRAFGEDGFYQISEITFRPVIAFESLGEHTDLAHSLGEQFITEYPNQIQRAEAIFRFVRDRVNYTTDIDQFNHEEYAQNADELASIIVQNRAGYGDCEDSTVLLAIMYKGAGYRSAIAVGPGHTAAMVYLPDYKKAAVIFQLDGESGWVWAEATAKNNHLGWAPKEVISTELAGYEISEEPIAPVEPLTEPSAVTTINRKGTSSLPFPLIGVIVLLWLLPLFCRRRAR